MSYQTVNDASASLKDRIKAALLKQAGLRAAAINDASDQRERTVCRQVIDGPLPDAYIDIVLIVLDVTGIVIADAISDGQIDTAITAANPGAWNYIVKSRV